MEERKTGGRKKFDMWKCQVRMHILFLVVSGCTRRKDIGKKMGFGRQRLTRFLTGKHGLLNDEPKHQFGPYLNRVNIGGRDYMKVNINWSRLLSDFIEYCILKYHKRPEEWHHISNLAFEGVKCMLPDPHFETPLVSEEQESESEWRVDLISDALNQANSLYIFQLLDDNTVIERWMRLCFIKLARGYGITEGGTFSPTMAQVFDLMLNYILRCNPSFDKKNIDFDRFRGFCYMAAVPQAEHFLRMTVPYFS